MTSAPCDYFRAFQKMRLLNLCSGTGSVSKSFVGWDIVEVDWDNRYEPAHNVDLLTWECPYEVGNLL